MRVALTGTPGTGKTTAAECLAVDLEVIHLNEAVRERGLTGGVDDDRDALVVDLDAVREWLAGRDGVLVESHLAHRLDVDRVVVLRCHPEELRRRLGERGEPGGKIEENAESEALDLILSESVAAHGEDAVYEIDTTEREPEAVAGEIEAAIRGERAPSAGTVDFTGYL